jgi:hypothetical protein
MEKIIMKSARKAPRKAPLRSLHLDFQAEITLRNRIEEELRVRTTVLDAAANAVVITDPDGTIQWVNPAFTALTGYTAQEIVGQNPRLLKSGKQDETVYRNLWQTISSGQVWSGELINRRKDGSLYTEEMTITPVRSADGTIARYIAIKQDVSERKRAEEEILKLNAELEQRVHDRTAQLEEANRELEAFSYSVSHDLRAPLRHIAGFADLLAKTAGPGLPGKSRHYLEEILDSAGQMGRLIDDLLLFSRMGRAEMRLQPVDLEQLVEDAKKQLEPENTGRDIRWKQSALLEVQGDRALLRQVMLNLLSNALKYTRPRRPAEIEIGCDGGSLEETVVFVRDNGVGFDMKYADKLFGVFQRLHLDEEFEGTGIGLASVRRIIARHGGRTWAEGKLNAGATFYFSLPKNNHPPDIYDRTETHSPG